MITELEKKFCYSYNIFNPDKFKRIARGETVDFNIDTVDGNLSPPLERLVSSRIKMLNEGSITMEFNDDVSSYNTSILIAAVASRGKRWFLDKEVAAFKDRTAKIMTAELINEFFGDVAIQKASPLESREMKPPRIIEDLYKVKWTLFSSLLKERKFTVRGGWIYAMMSNIVPIVVERFKKGMERKVKQIWKSLKDDPVKGILEKYSKLIDDMVSTRDEPASKPQEIDAIISSSPLCIRVLDDDVRHGVDVGYEPYLILAFYLKYFLSLEDLKRYFYERNPVNAKTFSSVDQYIASISNLAYTFSYMYGASGSGTNYGSYACKKIEEKDSCPFSSSADIGNVISQFDSKMTELMSEKERSDVIGMIGHISSKKWRGRACGMELCIKLGLGMKEKIRIWSPIEAYYRKFVEIVEKNKAPVTS